MKRVKRSKIDKSKRTKRLTPPAETLQVLGTPENVREYFNLFMEKHVPNSMAFSLDEDRFISIMMKWVGDKSITPRAMAYLTYEQMKRSKDPRVAGIPRYAVYTSIFTFLGVLKDLILDGWKVRLLGIGTLEIVKRFKRLVTRHNPRKEGYGFWTITDYYVIKWITAKGMKEDLVSIYNPSIEWNEYKLGTKPWKESKDSE